MKARGLPDAPSSHVAPSLAEPVGGRAVPFALRARILFPTVGAAAIRATVGCSTLRLNMLHQPVLSRPNEASDQRRQASGVRARSIHDL